MASSHWITKDGKAAVRIVAELATVSVLIVAATLVSNALVFRSNWNLIWLLGIPLGVGIVFPGGHRRHWALVGFEALGLVAWAGLSFFAAVAHFSFDV